MPKSSHIRLNGIFMKVKPEWIDSVDFIRSNSLNVAPVEEGEKKKESHRATISRDAPVVMAASAGVITARPPFKVSAS
jgi:hypothetical protein